MFFTNSIFLIGLGFALIPVIFHLIFKKQIKTIYFSTIIFIKNALKYESRKFKIKEILLLILRTLIIIFLVLSISHPVIYNTSSFSALKKQSIVFVIDNSMSMASVYKGKSLLNYEKQICNNIIDRSRENTDFSIIITSDARKNIPLNLIKNKNLLKQKINEIKISYIKTDIFRALQTAEKVLNTSEKKIRTIYLLSDFQTYNFKNQNSNYINKYFRIKYPVRLIKIKAPDIKNSAITKNILPKTLLFKNDSFTLNCEVKNFSNLRNNLIIKLFIMNNPYNQKSISLKSQQTVNINFKNKINNTGLIYGFTEITDGDNLTEDNKNYFLLYVPEKISISAIENKNSLFYVLSAIDPKSIISPSNSSSIKIKISDKIKYSNDTDLLLIAKNQYSENDYKTIKKYINNEKNIIFILPNNLNYNSFNKYILDKGIINGSIIGKNSYENNNITLEQIDFEHPLFNLFKNLKVLRNIKVKAYFQFKPNTDDINTRIIAKFSNNFPAIIEYTYTSITGNHRKIILFLFELTGKNTELVYNPNFPPLIRQLVKYTALPIDMNLLNSFKCGMRIDDIASLLGIEKYNTVKCLTGDINKNIEAGIITAPGIYEISGTRIAVNNDFNESNLATIDTSEIKKIYKGIKFIKSSENENLNYNNTEPMPLWRIFLIVALLLLIAELILSNFRKQ